MRSSLLSAASFGVQELGQEPVSHSQSVRETTAGVIRGGRCREKGSKYGRRQTSCVVSRLYSADDRCHARTLTLVVPLDLQRDCKLLARVPRRVIAPTADHAATSNCSWIGPCRTCVREDGRCIALLERSAAAMGAVPTQSVSGHSSSSPKEFDRGFNVGKAG